MLRDSKSRRLRPELLDDDKTALDAIKTFTDYTPSNSELATDGLDDAHQEMLANQTLENQMKIAWENQRDKTVKSEHAFHDKMIRAYDAVKGQYGRDSSQVQAMGRKRVSEYKRPSRRPSSSASDTNGGISSGG